jgi:sec-independent protein translocase protein TatA
MDIGPVEIAIIAFVVLVLFGSKKLPDAARSLGRSMRILKTEIKDLHEDETPAAELPAAPVVPVSVVSAAPAVTTPAAPASAGDHTPAP